MSGFRMAKELVGGERDTGGDVETPWEKKGMGRLVE